MESNLSSINKMTVCKIAHCSCSLWSFLELGLQITDKDIFEVVLSGRATEFRI